MYLNEAKILPLWIKDWLLIMKYSAVLWYDINIYKIS